MKEKAENTEQQNVYSNIQEDTIMNTKNGKLRRQ